MLSHERRHRRRIVCQLQYIHHYEYQYFYHAAVRQCNAIQTPHLTRCSSSSGKLYVVEKNAFTLNCIVPSILDILITLKWYKLYNQVFAQLLLTLANEMVSLSYRAISCHEAKYKYSYY